MLKKMTVLAMALGVVAALALPATASAGWTHGHSQEIPNDVQIGLTGQVGFDSAAGRIHCQVTSRAKFFAGQTTGQAETFVPHPTDATTNCVTGGLLSPCKVETVQPTNLPWAFHTTGTAAAPTIQVTFGDIHGELRGAFCLFKHSTVTGGTATFQPTTRVVDPDQQVTQLTDGTTVQSVDLSGTTQGHLYNDTVTQSGETVALQLTGSLSIEGTDSGTYSL